jgi:hypothetical protein
LAVDLTKPLRFGILPEWSHPHKRYRLEKRALEHLYLEGINLASLGAGAPRGTGSRKLESLDAVC